MLWRLIVFLLLTVTLILAPLKLAFGRNLVLGSLAYLLSASVVCWFMTQVFDRRPFASLGLAIYRGLEREILMGISMGLIMGFSHYGGLHFLGIQPLEFIRSEPLAKASMNFVLIFTAVAGEEMLTRGYLLQTLLTRCSSAVAVVLNSVIFAMMHFPAQSGIEMVGTFVFGAVLSLSYLKTKSLWFSIGFHTAWNFWGMQIAVSAISRGVVHPELAVNLSYVFWMLVSLWIIMILPFTPHSKAQKLWEIYIQSRSRCRELG